MVPANQMHYSDHLTLWINSPLLKLAKFKIFEIQINCMGQSLSLSAMCFIVNSSVVLKYTLGLYRETDSKKWNELIINLLKYVLEPVYLEAVVTDNTTERDDCVCYSQEMERRLHVSTALLQHKIICALVVILSSRVQLLTVNRCDPSFLFLWFRQGCYLGRQ